MLIIKYSPHGNTAYATVPEDSVEVRFTGKLRERERRDSPIGPIGVLESTGEHHTNRVTLQFGREATNARGHGMQAHASQGTIRGMELLDHKKHVRVLSADDERHLRSADAEIERLEAQLAATRDRRAEHVQRSWRQAEPLGLPKIEARAQAALAEGKIWL